MKKISDLRSQISDLRFQITSDFRSQISDNLRFQNSDFRTQNSVLSTQISSLRSRKVEKPCGLQIESHHAGRRFPFSSSLVNILALKLIRRNQICSDE